MSEFDLSMLNDYYGSIKKFEQHYAVQIKIISELNLIDIELGSDTYSIEEI